MIQRYDLEGATDILAREGLVLAPTDSLWCVLCDAQDPVALERLRRLRTPTREYPIEVLFPDLASLKRHTHDLHPRLETLLHFHTRPLTVLAESALPWPAPILSPRGQLAARIARDRYCQLLLNLYDRPLASLTAHFPNTPYPTHFGRIRSDIIEAVDYVAKYRPREATSQHPAVMVRLNAEDELEFVRE